MPRRRTGRSTAWAGYRARAGITWWPSSPPAMPPSSTASTRSAGCRPCSGSTSGRSGSGRAPIRGASQLILGVSRQAVLPGDRVPAPDEGRLVLGGLVVRNGRGAEVGVAAVRGAARALVPGPRGKVLVSLDRRGPRLGQRADHRRGQGRRVGHAAQLGQQGLARGHRLLEGALV